METTEIKNTQELQELASTLFRTLNLLNMKRALIPPRSLSMTTNT
ncbi:hypothetical protein [Flavobacterium sp. ZT3R18]|nr:hypothetical protein [Flavobacterium sp. ZT3R18]